MIGLFRSLAAGWRRFWMRRAARKLLAEGLPRGFLPAAAQPTRALSVPEARPGGTALPVLDTAIREPASWDTPAGEFWTMPLGFRLVSGRPPTKLYRLAALPPPFRRIDIVREPRLVEPPRAPFVPPPQAMRPVVPLRSAVLDLGVVRPRFFRLDAELRLPTEVDPLRIAPDAPPPARPRRVRPRTPLARAPIWRYRPANFRIDPVSESPANYGIIPLERRDTSYRWLRAAFKRQYVDMPWMARQWVGFMGPFISEWFLLWFAQNFYRRPGGRLPRDIKIDENLWWTMQKCKEQMLLRRDVKKDEFGPEVPNLYQIEMGVPIDALIIENALNELIPETEWVERQSLHVDPLPFDERTREVYLQWRTLMSSLEER